MSASLLVGCGGLGACFALVHEYIPPKRVEWFGENRRYRYPSLLNTRRLFALKAHSRVFVLLGLLVYVGFDQS